LWIVKLKAVAPRDEIKSHWGNQRETILNSGATNE